MRFHASILVVVAVTCVLAASNSTRAQAPITSCGPNDVVPWWPRFNASGGAETLTAAERKTVEARLAAVEALVRNSPYATPRGFAVEPWFSIHEITDRTQLYPYEFVVMTKMRCKNSSRETGRTGDSLAVVNKRKKAEVFEPSSRNSFTSSSTGRRSRRW